MFEIVLVPMYFLIGGWGYGKRVYAANKFFLYTMLGSAFMLVSLSSLAFLHQQGVGGDLTFDLVAIASDPGIGQEAARWIFLGFAAAFAVKVPLFPLHTWLPDAHTQAPTAGSVILAGVMLKLGTYGFLRFGVYLLPGGGPVLARRCSSPSGSSASSTARSWPRCRRTSSGWSPTRRWPTSGSSPSARSP